MHVTTDLCSDWLCCYEACFCCGYYWPSVEFRCAKFTANNDDEDDSNECEHKAVNGCRVAAAKTQINMHVIAVDIWVLVALLFLNFICIQFDRTNYLASKKNINQKFFYFSYISHK